MLGLASFMVLTFFVQSVGCKYFQIWKRDLQFDDKIYLNETHETNNSLHALSAISCGRMCKNGKALAFSHIEDECYCYKNKTESHSYNTVEGAQYYYLSNYFQTDEKYCRDNNYQYLSQISVCYKDYLDNKNWQDANAKCQSDGGYLIMLDTVEKLSVFQTLIPKQVYYWIGLEDTDQDGTWIWTKHRSKEYNQSLWFPGEPQGNEFCGMVQYLKSDLRVGLFDLTCHTQTRFICEM